MLGIFDMLSPLILIEGVLAFESIFDLVALISPLFGVVLGFNGPLILIKTL